MKKRQDTEAEQLLQTSIRSFLRGEMRSAMVLILWGVAAFALGAWCWSTQPDLMLQGASFPMMVFSAIHLATGLMQFVQTRKRAGKLLVDGVPEQPVLVEEMLRLDIQLPRLKFYRKTTLIIVLIGLAMSLAGSVAGLGRYMAGAGAGLALQAAITLVVDLFAAMRTGLFHHELRRFI